MKFRPYYLLFAFLLTTIACEDSGTSSQQTTGKSATSTTSPPPSTTKQAPNPSKEGTNTLAQEIPEKHPCTLNGILLEGNECYLKKEQQLVCIVADSTTVDMDFGESHRILEVYDTKDCSLVSRETLPVNYSPDFPYYINLESFEAQNKVICTQGYEYTFCYDVVNRKMLPRLEAQFLNERSSEDAQSGAPRGLKLWEQILFGYAQDYGAFAFDLSNKATPKALLPTAEFALPDRELYHSLFLMPTGEDRYQALVPIMEEEETSFEVRALFKQARKINPVLSKSVRNNRYLLFKDLDAAKDSRLAIDMQKIALVRLPENIAGQQNAEILKWLKAQE